MQKTWRTHTVRLLIPAALILGTGGQSTPAFGPLPARETSTVEVAGTFGRLPLHFEPNRGQTDPQVQYLSRAAGYTLFLTASEAVLVPDLPRERSAAVPSALRMKLAGANPLSQSAGRDQLPGRVNYVTGRSPDGWHTAIPTYAKVEYRDVYPGIDLVYYGNQRRLEHDFIIAPAADPRAISLTFTGADARQIDAQGDLVLTTGAGQVRLSKPVAYQTSATGQRQAIEAAFALDRDAVRFILGAYDTSLPLVIDPVLSYSTHLGGNLADMGKGIAVHAHGYSYITGSTSSPNFPPNPAATIPATLAPGASEDAFVARLDESGSTLLYATYFGGTDFDRGNAIQVDLQGRAYITGTTNSDAVNESFPVTIGAFDTACGIDGVCGGFGDAFVAMLSASGSLLYATYLGGAEADYGLGIAVDGSGQVYVAGGTVAQVFSGTFPVTAGAFMTTDPHLDGFLTKLKPDEANTNVSCILSGIVYNDCGDMLYSTFVNALDQDDEVFDIALDGDGNVIVVGWTGSLHFPTKNAFQTAKSGNRDNFVLKLKADNTNPNQPCVFSDPTVTYTDCADLLYASYLGGNSQDNGGDQADDVAVAVDPAGFIYVTGKTTSTDFPNGGVWPKIGTGAKGAGGGDVFVAKVDPFASGLASLIYAVYIGGTGGDGGLGIRVDHQGNAYIAGETSSTNFPGPAGGVAPKLGNGTPGQGGDAFLVKLNAAGDALVSTAYVGGTAADIGWALALDATCNAYVTGRTSSSNFPSVNALPADAIAGINVGSGGDAFVTKVAQSRYRAYIPQFNDNNVSVIDVQSNSVALNSIALGGSQPEGIAVHPDGSRVYISKLGSNALMVINTVTNTVTAIIDLGANRMPIGVAVHPSGSWVYVANSGFPPLETFHPISVIDTATNTLIDEIELPATAQANVPFGIAVHPDGTKIYVANLQGGFVTVIDVDVTVDPPTYAFNQTITVGLLPNGLALNPDGSRLFVANGGSDTVSVINTATNTKINFTTPSTDIDVGDVPFGVAVHPFKNKVYVTNGSGDSVSVITFTNPPPVPPAVATIAMPNGPRGIAVTPDGSFVYVANVHVDSVSVINAANDQLINFTSPDANADGDLMVGNGPVALGQFIGAAPVDSDGDHIHDVVDGEIAGGVYVDHSLFPANNNFTNEHLCGTVSGAIDSVPEGMTLSVTSPAGIVIDAVGGSGQAQVSACGFELLYDAGDVTVINSCGSLNASVQSGPVDVLLGTKGTLTASTGVIFRVAELPNGGFLVQHLGGDDFIAVIFLGHLTMLSAGESATFDPDSDGDGVPDDRDRCPDTRRGDRTDRDGCSGRQRIERACPCTGPASGGLWRNHGAYVACVTRETVSSLKMRLINFWEAAVFVSRAAHSSCGMPPPKPKPRR